MKKIYHLIGLLFLLFTVNTAAFSQSNIIIHTDSEIENLIAFHKECNQKIQKTAGFRVQIYANSGSNSLNSSKQIKENFIKKFPEVPVYISFTEPNFKVRAGNFRTRMDARCFLNEIKPFFPDSFVVKDEIYYPEL